MLYIPIKNHVDIRPLDQLKSPKGNHYKVICYLDQQVLKIKPLDVHSEGGSEMEFCIIKESLVAAGWQKML